MLVVCEQQRFAALFPRFGAALLTWNRRQEGGSGGVFAQVLALPPIVLSYRLRIPTCNLEVRAASASRAGATSDRAPHQERREPSFQMKRGKARGEDIFKYCRRAA